MKVITRCVIDINGTVIEEESFEYSGPVALCDGGGGGGGGGGDDGGMDMGSEGGGFDGGLGGGGLGSADAAAGAAGLGGGGLGGFSDDGWGSNAGLSSGNASPGGYGTATDEGFDDNYATVSNEDALAAEQSYNADEYGEFDNQPGIDMASVVGTYGDPMAALVGKAAGYYGKAAGPLGLPGGLLGKATNWAMEKGNEQYAMHNALGLPYGVDVGNEMAGEPYGSNTNPSPSIAAGGYPDQEAPRVVADLPRSAETPIAPQPQTVPQAPYSVPSQPVAPDPMIPDPVKKRTLDLKRASALTGIRTIPNPSQAYALTGRRT